MEPRDQVERGLEELSPFELKDRLIEYAQDETEQKAATRELLNAGRGNPNWVATTPREAFFTLGQFALEEAKRVWDEPDLGGMPARNGSADRLRTFLSRVPSSRGVDLLERALDYATGELGFEPDAFVHELTGSIIGDNYPVPPRMLVHAEEIVRRFLEREMCDGQPPPGRFDLFATEGGTAAMCDVFKTLIRNRLLRRGDTIAIGTPIFTPYLEIARLDEFAFKTVDIRQTTIEAGHHTWQYPDEELDKLADPDIKAFFLVNPANPGSVAMDERSRRRLVELVRTKRPDLIILTDDVYGTFVEGFRSLASDLPENTILVYSFSKHFGCTGWRLGVIAIHQDNALDRMIARVPRRERAALRRRYSPLTTDPDGLKLIDRLVADSRDVALNHTAGLSTPQQMQMMLLALFSLLDEGNEYKRRARGIVRERLDKLFEGMGLTLWKDPLRTAYYADLDLEVWGRHTVGDEFVEYVKRHREPIDVVIGLARRFGTVLLNGSGFNGPPWSVRVSLANLDTDDYEKIGQHLAQIMREAVAAWRDQQKQRKEKRR